MTRAFRIARLYKWVLVLGALLAVASASEKMIRSPLAHGDMEAYLHAARLIRTGEDIYASPSRPPEMGGLYYIYPPALAILFLPLTYVPVEVAIVVWSAINVILIGWIVKVFYEGVAGTSFFELPTEERWTIAFFSVLPPSRFILHHLFYGQANILILAMAVFAVSRIHKGQPASAGFSLGLSVAIKIITFPLTLWFLLRRNGQALAGIILGGLAGLFLPALVFGFGRNADYLLYWFQNIALYDIQNSKVPLYVNVSLQAQLYRFFSDAPAFTFRGEEYRMTLFQLPDGVLQVGETVLVLMMFGAILAYWYRFGRADEPVSSWGGVAFILTLIPAFSPFAQKHYFVMLLPGFVYVVYAWYRLNLIDVWFRRMVMASFALLFLTNEEFCGEWLGAVFTGAGCIAWGTLAAGAAIVRVGQTISPSDGKSGVPQKGTPESLPT